MPTTLFILTARDLRGKCSDRKKVYKESRGVLVFPVSKSPRPLSQSPHLCPSPPPFTAMDLNRIMDTSFASSPVPNSTVGSHIITNPLQQHDGFTFSPSPTSDPLSASASSNRSFSTPPPTLNSIRIRTPPDHTNASQALAYHLSTSYGLDAEQVETMSLISEVRVPFLLRYIPHLTLYTFSSGLRTTHLKRPS